MDQCPGDGYPLLLAAGETAPLLPHRGVQPLRHVRQIARQSAALEGLFHLLIREVPAEGDIVPDGGVEEKLICC